MNIIGIDKDQVLSVWHKIDHHIARALERGLGEWEPGDILSALLLRDMQLWSAEDLSAVAVTQIVNYPQVKICDVVLLAGSGLADWKGNLIIENWAKQNGCSFLRCYGRRGWARAVGWSERQAIAVKEL